MLIYEVILPPGLQVQRHSRLNGEVGSQLLLC
jgi:hypothetical protein